MTTSRFKPFAAVIFLLAIPCVSSAPESLDQALSKTKPGDGTLWSPLVKGGVIAQAKENEGKILLTFDDGPDHRTTPVVLDILDRANVKAVFLVNGYHLSREAPDATENRSTLREIFRRGHYIGNHTFIHQPLDQLPTEAAWEDINHCEQLITSVIGRSQRLFRPPFGKLPQEIRDRLDRAGFTVVLWSLDPEDWRIDDPRVLVSRVMKLIEENPGGGILLLHDTNRIVVEALSEIIRRIREVGAMRRRTGGPPLEIAGAESFFKARGRASKEP